MAIRPTKLSWANYRKAARILKQTIPGITPQQIIGRLGFPIKNSQRIFITSDGLGGVKQRNRTAHEARNRLYQKRRRIQTGQLSPQQLAESRRIKDETRADGLEVDHFNEIAFIGRQLEALEAAGGDVQAALQRLRNAGYSLGDDPNNLQPLSPQANVEKNQQSEDLQTYLGGREALGQSPSARNSNLIVVGEDLSQPTTVFPQENKGSLVTTRGQTRYVPPVSPGFDTSEQPGPSVTAAPGTYSSPQVMETNGNGNGNGNGYENGNGNGNGNGGGHSNGNGNGNGNGSYVDQLIDYTRANEPTHKTVQDAIVLVRAGKVIWKGVQGVGAVLGAGAASP